MIMSKLQFAAYPAVAAFALAAAFAAHAQSTEGSDYDFASYPAAAPTAARVVTRAPVNANVIVVRSTSLARTADINSPDYNPDANFKSTKTRAEVLAEVMAVPRDNRLAAVYGEDIGNFYYANVEKTEHRLAQRIVSGAKSGTGQ
jgi:hypothetical protein